MTWLQENWIIAVVGLVVAIALLWWLFGRSKAEEAAPPTVAPAEPRKPLEPTKPDIVAAEPARFKPVEPAPAAEAPLPAPAPVEAPPPPTQPAAAGDNLRLLKGVGPKLATLLNDLGITRFDQIAAWTEADIAAIDPQLGTFQGRIVRDDWVDQASYLARRDKAGFEAKYGALGGEL